MPPNVQIGLLILGGVLILIAFLGGNFKLFGAEVMATLSSRFLRFVAFLFGVLLLVAVWQPYPNEVPRNPPEPPNPTAPPKEERVSPNPQADEWSGKYLMDNLSFAVIVLTHLENAQYRIEAPSGDWPWEGTATIGNDLLSGNAKFRNSLASMNVEGIIRRDGSIIIKYRFITDGDGNPNTRVDEHVWYPTTMSSQLQMYLMDNDQGRIILVKSIGGDQYRVEEPSSPWPWEGTATIANGSLSGEAKFRNGLARMDIEGTFREDEAIIIKYRFITDGDGNPNTRVDEHIWYPVTE